MAQSHVKMLVENNFFNWLLNKYKEDIKIYSIGKYGNNIIGRYKGNTIRFMIDKKDKLMISISKQSEDLLDDFIEDINEYLGYSPLCAYDITLNEIEEDIVFSTLEWRKENIEERLIDITNMKKSINGVRIDNIKIFNKQNYKKSFVKKIKSRKKLKNNELNFWYSL